MQPFAVASRGFHQSAHKLIANTKWGNVIKIFFVWKLVRELLKIINTSDIFKTVVTEQKLAKKRMLGLLTKLTENVSTLRIRELVNAIVKL